MTQMKKNIPGVILCLAVAIPAWFLGEALPVIGSPVFGILFGMLMVILFPKLLKGNHGGIEFGVKYTSKKLLQYSIILLGFGMNLFQVLQVGGQSLYVIVFTLSASFLTAFFIGKILKLDGKMTTLIGVGTSICGGSAIAATAPVIKAKDEDVAHAISTIFLFNIIAVFIFPAMGAFFGMSDQGFGMWAGTAINDTSSVVAAGTAWSNAAGNNAALSFATIVKLTRTLMIVPITLILAAYEAHKAKKYQAINSEEKFSVTNVFPWFVIGFVLTAIINTYFAIPVISDIMVRLGKFMIVMAMTAIGLNTNLKKLITNGVKPIFLGVCCWVAVASVSLLIQRLLHIW
ncbi:hypothetical protein SDC9_12834 [bioreactor metagenome]|uniref:Sulfate exporter family transporter n=1 Tax=bioreactor metagenome TaxID=1076179 RepID=A0A644TJR4_9ZZZZ|nr:YeiH family protein [Acidaminococcaceae bacterium]